MPELKLQQTKLKESVPPRDCFHESKWRRAYLWSEYYFSLALQVCSKKTKPKGTASGVINNVNLLFPLYGDKGVIFIFN